MSAAKCAKCAKTAYPLESVSAAGKTYHKGCFRCSVCRLQLTIKNFQVMDGDVFCNLHVPKARASSVADTIAIRQATSAPKRVAEGLGNVQKGTGEKPNVSADTIAIRQATNAPKRVAENIGNIQKGTGGKPQMMAFGSSGFFRPCSPIM